MDRSSFVRLRNDELPPPGAVVLGTDKVCGTCQVIAQDGDYIAYTAGAASAAGLIPNSDFEEVGSTELGSFGAPIFGWSTSENVAIRAGGARSDGAHLVLAHRTDTTSTKQATSSTVAIKQAAAVALEAFVRAPATSGSAVTVTIALVELDGDHNFVTWHRATVGLEPSDEWQMERIPRLQLDPKTAYVNVSCYLEPGGQPGAEVDIDDIVVDYVP